MHLLSQHKQGWWEFLTHRVSRLPDGNLAGKDIEVFPRLTVIPELQKNKDKQRQESVGYTFRLQFSMWLADIREQRTCQGVHSIISNPIH